MESLEPTSHMNESLPYFGLLEVGFVFDVIVNFLQDIPCFSYLHHDAECLGAVIEERLLVVDDVGVGD